MNKNKLPDSIQKSQNKIKFTNEGIENPQSIEYSGSFASIGVDNSKTLKDFEKDMKINILSLDEQEISIEIIGIDAPIANALRRIIVSEIPTMAIEKVILYQNTSIIHDEILCHRLGLVPIQVDPRPFIFKKDTDEENDVNTIKFSLHVKCEKKPQYKNVDYKQLEKLPVDQVYTHTTVYASDLKWIPIGNQAEIYKNNPPKPVHGKVIIAKLRPGQEIEAELKCEKGRGKVHAKWSPVASAYYRLMPDIEITKEIVGEDAEELVKTCPMGVFDIEDVKGIPKAKVGNAFDCTMCRECIRNDKFTKSIDLGKARNHYIFTIESVGMLSPADLFKESLQILKEKCHHHYSFFEDKKAK